MRVADVVVIGVLLAACSSKDPVTPDAPPDDGSDLACAPNPCLHAGTCTATGATFTCACPAAYSGAACEIDVDECASDHGGCDPLASCTNTDGGRTCGACPAGYTGDGETGCADIDECLVDHGGCDALTTCDNIGGGRTCGACPMGYTGDGASGCTNIDECMMDHGGCDPLTTCDDTPGSRTCGACPADYAGTGDTGCIEPLACASDALDAMIVPPAHVVAMVADCAANPPICCTGGVPGTACGSVEFDYVLETGDLPRLQKSPASGPPRIDVTLRSRVRTIAPVPISLPIVGECTLAIESRNGQPQDLTFGVALTKLADANGPYLSPGTATIANFTSGDGQLGGSTPCSLANVGTGPFTEILQRAFAAELRTGTCTTCPCRP